MDSDAEVYAGLSGDAALVSLLHGSAKDNHIYNLMAVDARIFPRLAFNHYLETGEDYADDAVQGSHQYYQLDIVNRDGDVDEIAKEAESVMTSLGFYHVSGTKIVTDNDKSQIIEKHIQFVIYKEESN